MSNLNLKGIVLSTVAILALLSNASNPPNGRTGAPGDGNCQGCHNPPSTSISGFLDITGVPSTIDPNTTYTLEVTTELASGAATRAGFQMVALDGNNDNAGTLSNAGPSSTITTSGSRTYFEHSPSINFNGGSTVSWTVDWTSPAGPNNEDITFYASTILANGNGNTSGDQMELTDVTGTLDVGVAPLSLTIVFINGVSCPGIDDGSAEIMINGGTPPFDVNWDNGETGVTATMLPAGWVEVFVEDDNGEMTASSIFIGEPDPISVIGTILLDPSCGNPGSIELELDGGTSPYNFNWSTGSTDNPITNLSGGDYDVTITDSNGCEMFESYTLFESGGDIETSPQVSNVSCFGGNNGQITLNINAPDGVSDIIWNTGQNTETISNLSAGTYSVTVTDNGGCEYSESISVGQANPITLSTVASNGISCFGETIDTLFLFPSGGNGIYEVIYNNQVVNDTLLNWPGGMHTFFITDQFMCQDSAVVNIPVPPMLTASSTVNVASGPGAADGCISVTLSGGTPPYSYNGTVVQNPFNLENLVEGTYTLEFIDANGCTITVTEIISSTPCVDNAIATVIDATCFGLANGSISLNVSTGFTFEWSNGATDPTISGLPAGTYSVAVSETSTGCVQMISNLQVSSPSALEISLIDITQPECISGFGVLDNIVAIGGTPPYTFDLPTGALIPGTYTFGVVDANGCISQTSVDVSTQDLTPPVIILNDITTYIDAAGELEITGVDGGSSDNCNETLFFDYNNVPNCTVGNGATEIEVIVTDQSMNSTVGTTLLTILDTIPPSFICPNSQTISNCSTFSIPMPEANDNCGVSSLIQIAGPTTSSELITGLNEIIFEATDFHGNVSTCSYTIEFISDLNFDIEIIQPTCPDGMDGSFIIITDDSLSTSITYLDGNENLGSGIYFYEINDSITNCSLTDSVQIIAPDFIGVDTLNISMPSSNSATDGEIEVSINGGTEPYTFEWTDSEGNVVSTDQNLTGVSAGEYTLIVFDANGCVSEQFSYLIPMSTSINSAEEYSIKVYPNPVTDVLFIETDQDINEVVIYDAQGKYLSLQKNKEGLIDMSTFEAGLKILEIKIKDHVTYFKIFKN